METSFNGELISTRVLEATMSSGVLSTNQAETLDVFTEVGPPGTPLTTSEVADALDLSRRSSYDRLQTLVDLDALRTKKVGARGRVWWRPPANADGSETGRSIVDSILHDVIEDARVGAGIVVLDESLEVAWTNEAVRRYFGLESADVIGRNVRAVLEEHVAPAVEDTAGFSEAVLATYDGGRSERLECRVTADDGREARWLEHRSRPIESGAYAGGRVEIYADVTGRKRAERALQAEREQFESLVDAVEEYAIFLLDADGRVRTWNRGAARIKGHDRETILGEHFSRFYTDEDRAAGVPERNLADAKERSSIEDEGWRVRDDGTRFWAHVTITAVRNDEGVPVGYTKVTRDMTERREYERRLSEERDLLERIVETVGDGIYAVNEDARFVWVNEAFCEMVDYDREEIIGRHATTVHGDEITPRAERLADEVVAGERDAVTLELDLHTKTGNPIPVESRLAPFPLGDGYGRCGVVRDVSDRIERERELERQRERLAALNDLNEVVREITDAVIEQSTRTEIEEIVCDRLAASESYLFAWIGDVDTGSRTVRLRTEAGVEGYLDDVTISIDPDDERSGGPTGRAALTREVQTSRDMRTESSFEPWRDRIERYGFRSSAAIPIVHEGTLYGVLNVYAERPHAFTDDEHEVTGQLGEVVGHAIASVDRKRALTSDEVTELEFLIRGVFDAFEIPAEGDGRITLDRTVPVADGDHLVYGTATNDMLDALDALVESVPSWNAVTLLDETDEITRFELRLTEPPVLSAVASQGGYVERAVIEDGDYYMRIHLAPSTEVRQITELVEEAYPMIQLVTKRQVRRDVESRSRFSRILHAELTERQRSALEAAYFAGYFEWPRDSSGEEVAASMGISAPTFHQHLRRAQREVFQVVLGG